MKKLLIIALLIVGCATKPEPEDCAGVPGGAAELDNCNICDTDKTNDCVQDCTGEWGGPDNISNTGDEASYDECGNCGGSGIVDGTCDCDGNILDECGVCGGDGSLTCIPDIDGNVYETVQIGEQLWMAENLKVTKYKDGSEIPTGHSNEEWSELETGAYAVYTIDDDEESESTCGDDCAEVYGNLYNWFAVDDSRGLCMDGWHIPSDEEIMELEMFLGMSEEEANSTGYRGTDEGSKLAGNSELWGDGDLVNNSEFGTSGFNGIPAGDRYDIDGSYYNMGYHGYGYFWSSSETNSTNAWTRKLYYNNSNVYRYTTNKHYGFSIRCLGD